MTLWSLDTAHKRVTSTFLAYVDMLAYNAPVQSPTSRMCTDTNGSPGALVMAADIDQDLRLPSASALCKQSACQAIERVDNEMHICCQSLSGRSLNGCHSITDIVGTLIYMYIPGLRKKTVRLHNEQQKEEKMAQILALRQQLNSCALLGAVPLSQSYRCRPHS